ncbi:uncharacterized protein LOC123306667 isoform X2 [Coccinella septempunctata]|uniref:uncharacterized protein LOC123306667 isoform X2 n=1 Tax=Coccinella septempunctata TaxID=41139 RepID=UPI001D06550D|nr:uncharacterized protein LOC123306667 isoform X2 [Coccinella septempunctata]
MIYCIDSDVLQIPGYSFVRNDREGRGGGVAAYIKQNFKYQIISIGQQYSLGAFCNQLFTGRHLGE